MRSHDMNGATLEELRLRAHDGDEAALVALADRLDAEGRHTDALNELARAANRGSALAKGKVGARLLTGDRAPLMTAQGAGLVAEAAESGSGEATAFLAVLAGVGYHRQQSWDEALDLLRRAAELGFARAGRQLAVLAAAREDLQRLQSGERPSPDLWRRLRDGIDPAALARAPEGRPLSAEPRIEAFPGFLPSEMCSWIVARSRPRLSRAMVYDSVNQAATVNETRTNSVAGFSLLDTDLVNVLAQARMAAAAGVPFSHLEAAATLHYAAGEEITEHYDFVDPASPDYERQIARDGQRVVTFLIYLNDDYEGGETEFPRLGVRHKGRSGEGLLFSNALPTRAPDLRTVHAGRPPTRGEKWIVSQFIRDRPVLPGARASR